MKRWLCTLVLSTWLFCMIVPAAAQAPQERLLARVDLHGAPEALGLPVHAVFQDASGQAYALVMASAGELVRSGSTYYTLDAEGPFSYLILTPYRSEVRERVAQLVPVLHDDGQQLIVRASLAQADALAALGCDLAWLPESPLVLKTPRVPVRATAFVPDAAVAQMVDQVQASTLYTYVAQLSGETPALIGGSPYTIATRHTTSGTPLQMATQFAYEHFEALGLDVSYHDWTYGSYSNRNVVAEMPGVKAPDEIVLVTAHIDDMPFGSIAPGADDNGSGTAGVLVAADIMRSYAFSRTVRFVLFTGEEQGLLGSSYYADAVYAAGDNIVAVYNMDMIAWDSDDQPTLRIHTRVESDPGYAADLAIAGTFTNVVSAYGLSDEIKPVIDPDGMQTSDHSRFWDNGYPAVLAIEDNNDDFNVFYHTVDDLLGNLNMTYFTHYVKASVGTVAHLAVPSTGVVAGFTSSAPHPLGWVTYFTNTTTGREVTYQWDFGDASPIVTTEHPTHTYAMTGAYTVVLTATNTSGTDVAGDMVIIGPADCVPAHDIAFTYAPLTSTIGTLNLGVQVTFTATAQGTPPIDFTWDFEGASASGVTVTHTYALSGMHVVTLTVENPCARRVVTDTLTVDTLPSWASHRVFLPLVLRSGGQ